MHQEKSANELIANFCRNFNIKPAAAPIQPVGQYGLVDLGPKSLDGAVDKLWRKMDEDNYADKDVSAVDPKAPDYQDDYYDYIDERYQYINGHEDQVFNFVRDYIRCSVIVPDYTKAPALIQDFLQKMGGKLNIHGKRPEYKAFHLHTQLNGINCEIQFHTPETLALKEATHDFYEQWRGPIAKNPLVKNDPAYLDGKQRMTDLCNSIYERSGFDQAKPLVEALTQFNQPIPSMQYNSFLMLYRDIDGAQKQLATLVRDTLARHNEQEQNPDHSL